MPHAIWKGNISFGLVNIPVELYTAEKGAEKLNFTLLDRKDLSPVGYRRFNKKTGKEVKLNDIVRGYEYEEGRFVVLGDEDFRRANIEATQTVEIVDFVDADRIHPIFFEKPYYLVPAGKNQKSYALLRETLKRTKRAGIAKVVIHTREYIAALIPYGKVLELDLLRYSDELTEPEKIDVPVEDFKKLGLTDKEIRMAEKLVEGMYSDWDPAKYHDTYHDELRAYIKKKVEAGETAAIEEVPPAKAVRKAEVIDLMALLKKSVEKTGAEKVKVRKAARK
jgi:DNA end-binding protein Ku